MHYHHVLLVRVESPEEAVDKVEEFLNQYGEGQVWDWWVFGGRWSWGMEEVIEQHKDVIIKPGTNVYWNPYHDEEIQGQRVELEFPDGTVKEVSYGHDVTFALEAWVHENPVDNEIIDANHPEFWKRLRKAEIAWKDAIAYETSRIKEEWTWHELWRAVTNKDDLVMAANERGSIRTYRLQKALRNADKWTYTSDSYFFNIEDYSKSYDEAVIRQEPQNWFLVNCDLHN